MAGKTDDDIWISSGGLRWFDGYDGQYVAIFDDFRNKDVAAGFAFFLRLLDRYPVAVEFKGGFAAWVPRVIFITCPYSPTRCFAKHGQVVPPEDLGQLDRRITRTFEFEHELTESDRRLLCTEVLGLVSVL